MQPNPEKRNKLSVQLTFPAHLWSHNVLWCPMSSFSIHFHPLQEASYNADRICHTTAVSKRKTETVNKIDTTISDHQKHIIKNMKLGPEEWSWSEPLLEILIPTGNFCYIWNSQRWIRLQTLYHVMADPFQQSFNSLFRWQNKHYGRAEWDNKSGLDL